jgi:hypothetical protein
MLIACPTQSAGATISLLVTEQGNSLKQEYRCGGCPGGLVAVTFHVMGPPEYLQVETRPPPPLPLGGQDFGAKANSSVAT